MASFLFREKYYRILYYLPIVFIFLPFTIILPLSRLFFFAFSPIWKKKEIFFYLTLWRSFAPSFVRIQVVLRTSFYGNLEK